MVKISLHPVEATDIKYVADHMREDDKREVLASYGGGPLNALVKSVAASDYPLVARKGDVPVALIGCVSSGLLSTTGKPWLLGTDQVAKHAKSLCSLSREHINIWLDRYELLENYVDSRNHLHIKWLKHMGFEFGETIGVGILKIPFHRFYIGR